MSESSVIVKTSLTAVNLTVLDVEERWQVAAPVAVCPVLLGGAAAGEVVVLAVAGLRGHQRGLHAALEAGHEAGALRGRLLVHAHQVGVQGLRQVVRRLRGYGNVADSLAVPEPKD